jgi:nicotinate (nicotinamide) nucleotide adenylyltransferase
MIKKDEIDHTESCLNKARDNERLFVLLARDAAAPVAVRAWVAERLRLGKNQPDDAQIREALDCASRMEIERVGPSYTLDTLLDLMEVYGRDAGMYFIVGADEAFDLPRWHEAEKLPDLARFLVAPRPGFDLAELKQRLPARFYDAIDFLPMTPTDISATEIRSRIASGRSIKYLVPDCVEAYIRKHRLYLEDNSV